MSHQGRLVCSRVGGHCEEQLLGMGFPKRDVRNACDARVMDWRVSYLSGMR